MARGIVFLTDGFERLDLPGRTADFRVAEDWEIIGTECRWKWPHKDPATAAGAEIITPAGTYLVEIRPPILLAKGNNISATPRIHLGAEQLVAQAA